MKYFLSLGLTTHAANAEYLLEFINYYSMIGIEHFYINVNNTGTDVEDLLSGFDNVSIERHEVDQIESNRILAKRAMNESQWLLVCDDDEYVVPYKDKNLKDFVKRVAPVYVDEIVLSGYNFGNSEYQTKTEDSVINRFRFRSVHSTNTKSIFRPCSILPTEDNNHSWHVAGDIVDETGAVLDKNFRTKYEFCYDFTCNDCWINHYLVKSTEECKKRYQSKFDYDSKETFEKFMQANNENDIYDNRILTLIERIQRDNKN